MGYLKKWRLIKCLYFLVWPLLEARSKNVQMGIILWNEEPDFWGDFLKPHKVWVHLNNFSFFHFIGVTKGKKIKNVWIPSKIWLFISQRGFPFFGFWEYGENPKVHFEIYWPLARDVFKVVHEWIIRFKTELFITIKLDWKSVEL